MAPRPHVGTLGEKPLHAALKRWYAESGDGVEVPVDGFVVDLVRDGLLIEIQTRNFSGMKRKLRTLLEDHPVRLVHPVPAVKWIVKLDDDGGERSRRRSPKRGRVHDVFAELVSFPDLIEHPNLSLEVLLTHEEEIQRFDGQKGWRRRGWVVDERRLIEVVDWEVFASAADLAALLPPGLATRFTTADVAAGLDCPRRLAQQMAYCLRHSGTVVEVAKEANAVVYERHP